MSSVSMVDGHIDPDKNEMTPKKAYKILKDSPIRAKGNHAEYSKALHLAMAALEKQIPKNPKTEFERIKAMSIDEMAEYFLTKSFDPCDITNFPVVDCDAGCDKCIRKWLESEVEEE